MRLLETTLIRVGNEEYARDNRSFGLTTLRDQHVDVNGSTLQFKFRGKSGKRHAIDLARPPPGADRQALPGPARARSCSSTLTTTASRRTSTPRDVNDYLREIAGAGFHRQGFSHLGRHRAGRVALQEFEAFDSPGPGQEEHRPRDRDGGRAAGQHAGRLPQVLRPPGGPRAVPGRHDARTLKQRAEEELAGRSEAAARGGGRPGVAPAAAQGRGWG